MGKIMSILQSMGVEDVFDDKPGGLLKQGVTVNCDNCMREILSTADAVYRQYRRGNTKFLCKSCAGKKGWTPGKRQKAKNKTLRHWQDPEYAGEVSGKAVAREVIRQVEQCSNG